MSITKMDAPHQRHSPSRRKEAFPRVNNEPYNLVDVDAYLDYIVDDPSQVPLEIGGLKNPFVYQHLYWQESFYRQRGVPEAVKDYTLINFQASPYQQIGIRRAEETHLHLRFEDHILPPHPHIMEKAVADFRVLDDLGAAAIGKKVAILPEAVEFLAPGNGTPKVAREVSNGTIAELFDARIDADLEALRNPLITSQRVITSVIARLARQIGSYRLQAEAERRLAEDGVHYPLRLNNRDRYYQLSNVMLPSLIAFEDASSPLQTEESRLKLVA